jgi:AcrR family transcriptional regulator
MTTPARPPSSRAVQAEQTRQQILETAGRLFAEIGYDATSIQMIADEMGLTKAAVYYHFRAKSDLLHAVMLPANQRLAALMDEAEAMRGRRARVEHLVDGYVEFLVRKRHYMAAAGDPAVKRLTPDEMASGKALRDRGLTLVFGDSPTGAERLSYNAAFSLVDSVPELADLSDEELGESLRTTMLRILRTPS